MFYVVSKSKQSTVWVLPDIVDRQKLFIKESFQNMIAIFIGKPGILQPVAYRAK